MKFYLEFEPCNECNAIIRELTENSDEIKTQTDSTKFLRHITYRHEEVIQAIFKEFPRELKKQEFPWFG